MNFFSACGLALLLASPSAWAINKCIGADGKPVFQDAPCAGKGEKIVVKPAAGDAPEQDKVASSAQAQDGQRLERQLSQMQVERRRRDLETAIPRMTFERANFMEACDREMQALQDKKARANNNLAGATWLQSVSTEMTALSSRCEARSSFLASRIETMRQECQSLGGCR